MAGFLSTVLGGAKLFANVLGGGSGSKSTTSGNQKSTTRTQGSTTANRREYSDGFLAALEQSTSDALGSSAVGGAALRGQIEKVQAANLGGEAIPFDMDAFVRGVTDQASNLITNQANSNIQQTASATGGSTSGNSQAALLASRINNDAAANIAGVRQQATAQGAQIKASLRDQQVNELASGTQQLAGLQSSVDAGLATLLNALRGGETYQEVSTDETTNASGSGTQTQRTPFNWTKGLGNLFADINQDA